MLMKTTMTRRRFCKNAVATSIVASVALPANASEMMKAKPFVKWAGGKGQLIAQLQALFPSDLSQRDDFTYVEPFVGGGAMLFYVLSHYPNITHAVINDLNSDLIKTYRVVRDKPEELIELLIKMQDKYQSFGSEAQRQTYYLEMRERYNAKELPELEIASLFIFLNRTCFNGLYRVNSKCGYNVPFGKAANPLICDEATICADSLLLKKVEILNGDFEIVEQYVKGRSFYYFDPPYRPLPKSASFTSYLKGGFSDEHQRRLAKFCRRLDKNGNQWLLSNSDPHNVDPNDMFFEEIFSGFDIQRVTANRMINSKADGRGKITELAIRNYKGGVQ